MQLDLIGKNAFVSGSTQGIGRASAFALASRGANVVLLARNKEKMEAILAELDTSQGQKHDYIRADFSDPDSLMVAVQDFMEQKEYEIGQKTVHILINNTGGPPGGPIAEASFEDFLSAYQQHLFCNHLLVQAVMEGMKAEGYGRIINVISTSVKQPIPGLGVSNTTRGAVANWAKTLAGELGPYGITVNNVLPGFTRTERLMEIIQNRVHKTGKSLEEVRGEMEASVPARRFAEAEEVAHAIAFLAGPNASYINGINLPVDGGRTGCL